MPAARRDLAEAGFPRDQHDPGRLPPWRAPQRRRNRSISSSRPTSRVNAIRANASTGSRRHRAQQPAKPAPAGDALHLDGAGSRYSKRSPTSRRCSRAMTTASGSARACSRAARFGVSRDDLLLRRSCADQSPTTTSPVAIPTRA